MEAIKNGPPQVMIEQIAVEPNGQTGRWIIVWKVKNIAARLIRLLAVRLPHGQFRSEELKFEPPVDLGPGEEWNLSLPVSCDELPGLVTENAFLIFYAVWFGEPWRIFVRIRVIVNSRNEPETAVELITTQQVGFSGVAA